MGLINEPETNMIIGKPLEVNDKIIYPVIRISFLKSNEGNINGMWVIPIAIVVEEGSEKFLIRLTDENIDYNDVLELFTN